MRLIGRKATISGLLRAGTRAFSTEVAPASPLSQALDYREAVRCLQQKDYKGSLVHLFRTKEILDHAKQQQSLEYYYVSNK